MLKMIERLRRPTISKPTNNIRESEKIVPEDRQLSIRLIAERMSIDKETMWQVLQRWKPVGSTGRSGRDSSTGRSSKLKNHSNYPFWQLKDI